MKYVVLDLEWNSPERKNRLVKEPIVLHGEIIQMGAVMMNEQMEETGSFEVKIKPQFYKKMNKKIEALTSITDRDLETGLTFAEAVTQFREWCGEDSIIFTWGPCDIGVLEDNLIMHGMDYMWIPEDFDAQMMFDFQETMENRNYSLDYAVYYFGIKGVKGHDALNDARDTAEVIKRLDAKEFVREEREWRKKCKEESAAS